MSQQDYSNLKVAVRVRPQNEREKLHMNKICTKVSSPAIFIGPDKQFTYDYVFDINSAQEDIFDKLAKPLIDGCLEGYNATILAYGQTGSGKTYTMGTACDVNASSIEESKIGIVPRAVKYLFSRIQQFKDNARDENLPPPEFKMVAHFIELYNEELKDLLLSSSRSASSQIRIHEDAQGGIYLTGVSPRIVSSYEDTMKCLTDGSISRSVGSTNMNAQSSRSHAIFTLHMKINQLTNKGDDVDYTDAKNYRVLSSKFHFVDLAGSERLGRTGATGDRKKEGISINVGLLALGNVISALGDKAKQGCHVPYRDAKLTRVLQDSLGGNSRTIMIACVSPSDCDFCETLNTLNYANRARNIKNKVVANQDRASKELTDLRTEIARLKKELEDYKQGRRIAGSGDEEVFADMHNENIMLKQENETLLKKVKAMNETITWLKSENSELLTEKELQNWLSMKQKIPDIDNNDNYEIDEVARVTQKYMIEIENLKTRLTEALHHNDILQRNANLHSQRSFNSPNRIAMSSGDFPDDIEYTPTPKRGFRRLNRDKIQSLSELEFESRTSTDSDLGDRDSDNIDEDTVISDTDSLQEESDNLEENDAEMLELTSAIDDKEKLIREIKDKNREIERIKHFHERSVRNLEMKIKNTEIERDKILAELGSVETTSEERVRKTKEEYTKRIQMLQKQLLSNQDEKRNLLTQMTKQRELKTKLIILEREVVDLKRCKVECAKRLKEESKRSREAEISHNKEIARLKKEKRLADNQIRTLQQEKRQRDIVLRRKNEEEQQRRRLTPYNPRGIMINSCMGSISSNTSNHSEQHKVSRQRRNSIMMCRAKKKWDELHKSISNNISQTSKLYLVEQDLNRFIKERDKLSGQLESLMSRKNLLTSEKDIVDNNYEVESIKTKIDMLQIDIYECQKRISDSENERPDSTSLRYMNSNELLYIIDKFIEDEISSGCLSKQKEREFFIQLEEKAYEYRNARSIIEYLVQQQNIPLDLEEILRINNDDDNSDSENEADESPFFQKVNKTILADSKKSQLGSGSDRPEDSLGLTEPSNHSQPIDSSTDVHQPALSIKPVNSLTSMPDRMAMSLDETQLMPATQNKTMKSQVSTLRISTKPSTVMAQSCFVLQQQETTANDQNMRRQLDVNVFNRLAMSNESSPISKGAIQSIQRPSSRPTSMRTPIVCTHVADGHKKPVLDLHVSKSIMVTGSKDRTAKVWDLKTMSEIASLPDHPNNVNKVWHIESKHLILTVSSHFVKMWDDREMKCVKTLLSNGLPLDDASDPAFPHPVCLPAGQSNIIDLVVSNSGELMFTAAGNSVKMWDLRMFSSVCKLHGNHQAQVMVLAQGTKGDDSNVVNVVTGSKDHYIKVFAITPRAQGLLYPTASLQPPHYDGIEALVLHNNVLFSGSRDACIKKWDIDTARQTNCLNNAHKDWIQGLSVSEDGLSMFSGCRSGILKVWNANDCSFLAEVQAHQSAINSVKSLGDRVFTASNDSIQGVRIWKIDDNYRIY